MRVAIHTAETGSWRRNLGLLWFGAFISEGAISMVLPVMPLYLKTLGHYSTGAINLFAGAIFAVTFLVKAVVSPFWGKLSDRIGHKIMLLRSAIAVALCLLTIAFAPNVWVILIARALQGGFSGYINNAESIVAADTPLEHSGAALGTLATGDTAGLLCGPIAGGILATVVGYQGTFLIAGAIVFLVFIVSALGVHENFTPVARKNTNDGIIATMKRQAQPHLLVIMFLLTFLIQATNNAVSPVLSLYIESLGHIHNLALICGIIAALPGFATIMSATYFGRLGERIGQRRLLWWALCGGVVLYMLQIGIHNLWLFACVRFLTGFSVAALLPAVQTMLTHGTEHAALGRIFSYNQAFQALGNVAGAMLSAVIATACGYTNVFTLVVVLELLGLLLVWRMRKQ